MREHLTIEQASEFLGCSVNTLRHWIAAGKGPRHKKFMKRLWFDRKDLEAFLRRAVQVRAS
jgi:excisionase family DNA binding protein